MPLRVLRLRPGQELFQELWNFCRTHKIEAGFFEAGKGEFRKVDLFVFGENQGKKLLEGKWFLEKVSGRFNKDSKTGKNSAELSAVLRKGTEKISGKLLKAESIGFSSLNLRAQEKGKIIEA
ncbi:MAG: DUF296 domain-containing protein [Candidatus Diapherotrites archaeon]|nr:DUF296 domain-containing protein [Candidatus Diapherotrites archaeon]